MPRRRRKRPVDSMRPALTFLESPVHVEHSPPSPVYCSDNPATAKVVPLEELPEWTWVSPQFDNRGRFTAIRRRRHTDALGRNTTIFTRSRSRNAIKSPSKFKTLAFQDGSQRPPSPVQHLVFDENCDTLTANDNSNLSKVNQNAIETAESEKGIHDHHRPVTRSRSLTVSDDLPTETCTPRRLNSSMPESPYDVHTPTDTATPKRHRNVIYRHLFSNECTTPVTRHKGDIKVLVYDTPEEDYGVPMHLRGKKYRKHHPKPSHRE